MSIMYDLLESWSDTEGNVNSLEDIYEWFRKREKMTNVIVEKRPFSYDGFWYYDEKDGYIRNENNSFFQIAGYQEIEDDRIIKEQPIILQNEIGYLGIICKKIDGRLNFLMQAKIEPGNVNVTQLSPTIQATKSNFKRMHGGDSPKYLEYFENASKYNIIVDQLQSEQSSRFFRKRNRNIIIEIDEDEEIKVYSSHKWMTLGQIKKCLEIKNMVNMDTRTVLSCIPFSKSGLSEEELLKAKSMFTDKTFFESMFRGEDRGEIRKIFNVLNDYKMYRKESSRLVPLKSLKGWEMTPNEIICRTPYDFKVIYCFIEIEGREVNYWEQPLLEATGMALFGLYTKVDNGVRKFLIKAMPEMGCYDTAEMGPTVQLEPSNKKNSLDAIEKLFLDALENGADTMYDVILSEEGGRFYHEENRNVIIDLKEDVGPLSRGYFWVDYATLNQMIQYNNCVNIQLRNLMSLLKL